MSTKLRSCPMKPRHRYASKVNAFIIAQNKIPRTKFQHDEKWGKWETFWSLKPILLEKRVDLNLRFEFF